MVVKIEEELLKYINFNYELLFEIKAKEYMAAYKIQQWWKKILMSPHTKVGKRFINKKYDELFE